MIQPMAQRRFEIGLHPIMIIFVYAERDKAEAFAINHSGDYKYCEDLTEELVFGLKNNCL